MIEHLDHLDLPWREPERGQPLEGIDLGIGDEGGTEPVRSASVRKPGEPGPEIDQAPWQRREGQFGLELLAPLRCPGSIEEPLDVFPRRDAVFVRRGKCKIRLGMGL
ncbi:MAG: hypothetical protein ABS35_15305 [Kaistia sp. SCN 65-12]|nr:MAG: hypothetical protein ABS35_15305 [Kaistia sp. SCN 65-12]